MEGSIVSYKVRLEAVLRLDGSQWLAWCPSIDVMSQAETKKKALASLQEAVELWFESCIERDVLDKALTEAGFYKAKASASLPETPNTVSVLKGEPTATGAPASADADTFSFSRDQKGGSEYIEVSIPAYIAAHQLGQAARAPC
jgi:predicted RNase H-like HicB family nuclease